MAENLKRKTMNELPQRVIGDDIHTRLPMNEIFTRLPVKSLLRCKSVSKYWLSLISDPEFVKDYYKSCAIKNPNDFDCIVANKYNVGLVVISRNEETCILPPHRYEIFGSIYGLICLSNDDYSSYKDNDKKFLLWNPAIHQFKESNFPPGRIRVGSSSTKEVVGFGFDSVSNDYKVVVCRISLKNRSAFVYSSNSDKWSDLIIPDYVFPASNVQIPYLSNITVKDCPYWTTFPSCSPEEQFVPLVPVKFDTRSNEFKLLPEFQCKRGQNIKLVNMMDRPTLMEYEQDSQNLSVNIYSLNEEEGSGVWSKICIVERPIDHYRRFRNLLQGFKCGDEIVFEEYGRFSYYDHNTDKISHIPGTISSYVFCCFGYTPSLVFLKGMESDMKSNTHLSQLVSSLKPKSCP